MVVSIRVSLLLKGFFFGLTSERERERERVEIMNDPIIEVESGIRFQISVRDTENPHKQQQTKTYALSYKIKAESFR